MAIDDSLERARLHPDVLKNLNKNKKLKVAEAYSEDNPPPYPVISVNNKTDAVTLGKSDIGLENVDNVKQYSSSNPPPYPVTSVNGQTGAVTVPTVVLPLAVSEGGTGADNAADARANLQAAQMIDNADLAGYGLSVSGSAYNFTLAQLFQAVPSYSRVVIPWIQSQNTTRYGTLAAELPAAAADYGMLVLDKAASLGEFRFIQYSSSKVWHGSYTTVNSRGFNGWWSDQRVLLWTNPTPSTLAAGTQNFSMSGYSQIEIECTRNGSTSQTYFVRSGIGTSSSPVTVDLTSIRLETGNSNLNSITLMTRTADVYSTGIVFSSGQMIYNGGLYKNLDNRAVPYRVWGIR